MTETTIRLERRAAAATPRAAPANRQHRLNSALAVLLVAVAALAPLPLGSNRPFFLALWAALIGFVGAVYLLLLLLNRQPLRMPLSRVWLPALLFVLLLGFLGLQLWPLPQTVVTAAGDSVTTRQISMHPGATSLQILQLSSYGIYFFLLLQVAANRVRARKIGLALFFIVAAHATYGLAALVLFGDTLLFFEKWAYPGFATGGFVNRNSFATFLAFGLVLGITFTLRESFARAHGSKALIYLAFTGLIVAALLATGSRMGLFAGLVGAACAALMAIQKAAEPQARRKLLLLAALPLAAALLVATLFGTGTLDRLGSLENDANVRGDLYAQVLSMIAARPWLGYGGGAFELAFPLFHQWPVSPDLVWDKAHSTYLALWAELGLVAGSLPLLVVATFTLQALRLYATRSADWAAPAIAVAVVAVAAIHSLVDFSLEIEANAFLFLAILALAIARPAPVSSAPAAEGAEG